MSQLASFTALSVKIHLYEVINVLKKEKREKLSWRLKLKCHIYQQKRLSEQLHECLRVMQPLQRCTSGFHKAECVISMKVLF